MAGEERSAARYGSGAIVLHWLTAAAFAFQIGLGWRMNLPRGPQTFAVYQLHKSVGITILLLTLARIVWRLTHPAPPLPASLRPIERRLAHGVHLTFYVLLLALPLSGWLLVSSSDILVPTFLYGTVPWPHVPGVAGLAVATKRGLNDAAATAHGVLGWIALLAIVLHVAGALKHQFVDRGADFARMAPAPGGTLSAAAVMIVVAFVGMMTLGRSVTLTPIARGATKPTAAPAQPAIEAIPPALSPASIATPAPAPSASASSSPIVSPVWVVRRKASSIRFHTAWSQGAVDGGFGAWRAAIVFDPAALDTSSVKVTIDMASVTAASGDQEGALPEADWFAVAAHPTATWRTTGFRHLGGDRYVAQGVLTLRGVARPLPIPFRLTIDGDVATMAGDATIDRTAFGVGQGEWASTGDLPAAVTVSIAIKADRGAR